ncbi:hypothetical protein GCM10027612_66660 [Microbispora bryophytorum subsp. camponoti]
METYPVNRQNDREKPSTGDFKRPRGRVRLARVGKRRRRGGTAERAAPRRVASAESGPLSGERGVSEETAASE